MHAVLDLEWEIVMCKICVIFAQQALVSRPCAERLDVVVSARVRCASLGAATFDSKSASS
jgi:hypothetical protein